MKVLNYLSLYYISRSYFHEEFNKWNCDLFIYFLIQMQRLDLRNNEEMKGKKEKGNRMKENGKAIWTKNIYILSCFLQDLVFSCKQFFVIGKFFSDLNLKTSHKPSPSSYHLKQTSRAFMQTILITHHTHICKASRLLL